VDAGHAGQAGNLLSRSDGLLTHKGEALCHERKFRLRTNRGILPRRLADPRDTCRLVLAQRRAQVRPLAGRRPGGAALCRGRVRVRRLLQTNIRGAE